MKMIIFIISIHFVFRNIFVLGLLVKFRLLLLMVVVVVVVVTTMTMMTTTKMMMMAMTTMMMKTTSKITGGLVTMPTTMIRRLSICFPPKQEHNGTSVSYLLRREA
jgi:hypothetical protein